MENDIRDPRLRRVAVIGVPITATNMNDCLAFIEDHLGDVRGDYICISNVHTTVTAHDDPDYLRVQSESLMSLPDGKPLSVVGAKTVPSMGRVTGPDLMREVFDASPSRGWSHYFYGSTQENIDALRAALNDSWPDLRIAGMEPSVFRPLSDAEEFQLAARVDASGADFLWVALGAPRQEVLCHRLKGRTRALMVGVGGAFSVLAGTIPEAPRWMQNLSLEWLYRLVQEPGRLWKRYLVTNSYFLWYLATRQPVKKKE